MVRWKLKVDSKDYTVWKAGTESEDRKSRNPIWVTGEFGNENSEICKRSGNEKGNKIFPSVELVYFTEECSG